MGVSNEMNLSTNSLVTIEIALSRECARFRADLADPVLKDYAQKQCDLITEAMAELEGIMYPPLRKPYRENA
jgi:hypothetical protein